VHRADIQLAFNPEVRLELNFSKFTCCWPIWFSVFGKVKLAGTSYLSSTALAGSTLIWLSINFVKSVANDEWLAMKGMENGFS
jgi:hypothetical protein